MPPLLGFWKKKLAGDIAGLNDCVWGLPFFSNSELEIPRDSNFPALYTKSVCSTKVAIFFRSHLATCELWVSWKEKLDLRKYALELSAQVWSKLSFSIRGRKLGVSGVEASFLWYIPNFWHRVVHFVLRSVVRWQAVTDISNPRFIRPSRAGGAIRLTI